MKTRNFDVAILGTSLCGLVTAVLLARKGVKPIVLQSEKEASFDPALTEFLSGFTVRPFLKRAGFHPTEVNAIPALEVPVQVVHDRFRINFYGDEEKFHQELRREFPLHSDHILQLFKDSQGKVEVFQHLFNSRVHMPPTGFFARRQFFKTIESVCNATYLSFHEIEEELKKYHLDRSFSPIVEAIGLAVSNLVGDTTTEAHLSHLLNLLRWEGFHTEEGLLTMKKSLFAKIKEYGGDHIVYGAIQDFRWNGDQIDAVRLEGAPFDEITFDALVIAGNPRTLTPWIEKKRAKQRWIDYIDTLPIVAVKAYQIYRLKEEGVPVGMREQGLVLPKEIDGEERRGILRAIRYTLHPSKEGGEYTLALTAFIRTGGKLPSPEALDAQIRARMKDLLPFLDDFLIEPPTMPWIPNFEERNSDFREGFVYRAEKNPLFGVVGLDPVTPMRATYLANEMILPGLGIDGETIAGLHISDLILSSRPQKATL